jgi:hypothetical protein
MQPAMTSRLDSSTNNNFSDQYIMPPLNQDSSETSHLPFIDFPKIPCLKKQITGMNKSKSLATLLPRTNK